MDLIQLGLRLKEMRQAHNRSSATVASELGFSAAYYSRLENGKERPSLQALENINDLYKLPSEDKQLLEQLAGYSTASVAEGGLTDSAGPANPELQINFDPQKLPVLFSDTMFVSVSENGVVLDFGQKVATAPAQYIVARVGVSYAHAKKIHALLGDQLTKAKNLGIEN